MLLAFMSACSSGPDQGDAAVADAALHDGGGGMDASMDAGADGGMTEQFCKASTPPSDLHEGRCRNDDGTIDETATGTCLVDRDYMEFF